MNRSKISLLSVASLVFLISCAQKQENRPELVERVMVHQDANHFLGWPANNGAWKWDDGVMMVGFTKGEFLEQESHNIADENQQSWLAKSQDGGNTWEAFNPKGFVGDSLLTPERLESPINFGGDDFALRLIGTGYHGSNAPQGGFFYTNDRGESWQGPFGFTGLDEVEELQNMEFTPRTDYIIENDNTALVFITVRTIGEFGTDKPFVARTTDGGQTFEFVGWMVDPEDPYRAVMPSTVKTSSGTLVSAIRRRNIDGSPYCWIDVYTSDDNGETWQFASRAGETGDQNGNPPALIQLSDGRLLVAYGNREHRQIRARFSSDEGETWGTELVIREGTARDIGYPRLIQNEDGNIVTIYYWAESPESEKYIEATIWNPGDREHLAGPMELASN